MNQITNFWNHFKQNNFVFLLLNEIPKNELKIHFDKLTTLLRQYNKDLDLIIKNKNKEAEIIITANGNPYLFKEVELLVHHAPIVERWKTIAFLQPQTNISKYKQGIDKPIENYGISLRISEIYFEPLENPNNPNNLGVRIYTKNYIIHKDNPRLREVVYAHIEHLIGEKSFANNINFIEIYQFHPSENIGFRFIELYNLGAYIEKFQGNNNIEL
ncbi:hypothetical protein [Flavobacterium psychrophilum]|uniref:hypothetical protein n=1 Tax=Flavobacterium psychrophilum TaxID=96345 RepID=UPI00106C0B36|nr:hypothetical protein [Flavobacterium psychrophilum]